MAEKTIIAWTDHTFNVAWGCTKVSPGCKNCYAEALSRRRTQDVWGPGKPRRILSDNYWKQPIKWNKAAGVNQIRARVFTSSMCDVFEDHAMIAEQRARLWALIRATPFLDWQLLTKRAERIASCLPDDLGDGYPHVWLGVSVENQAYVGRVAELCKIPAVVRFVSYAPALGPLNLEAHLARLDWIIYCGESGPGHREDDPDWPRSMKEQCEIADVAFFFKQSSAARTEMGTTLDGETIREYPKPRLAGLADQDIPWLLSKEAV